MAYLDSSNILLLAKVLSQIHCKSLIPFYDDGDNFVFWEELDDITSGDVDELSKQFFIEMAVCVIKKINSHNPQNIIEVFAKLLYEIHASRLVPFYINESDLEKFNNDPEDSSRLYTWENLEYHSVEREIVDKSFFLKMASHVLISILGC